MGAQKPCAPTGTTHTCDGGPERRLAGEERRGKDDNDDDNFLLRCCLEKRVPERLWTTRMVPEGRRGTGDDGAGLATNGLAGAEGDDAGMVT